MKKGVLLARVSTPRQEKEGLSLEEIQLPHMQQYAREQGIEIVKEFTFSESADEKMRKQFQEMVTFAKKHPEVKAVIAYRVDRITRNFRDAVVCDELRKLYDKELHFVYNRLVIDKHSSGRDIADWDTQVYLAKQQINRLRDDGIESAHTQLRMGRKPGQAPIGYLNITLADERKDIIPDPERAPHIIQIFELYATGIHSDRTIAKVMKEKSLRTRLKGKALGKTSVETILKNPFYVGQILYQGKLYPHHYQTLINPQLFERCQRIRRERAEKGNYKPKYKVFALRGIVRCAYCSTVVGLDTKKDGRIRYIQCSKNRNPNCPQPRLHEKGILDQVKDEVVAHLEIPDEAALEVQEEVIKSCSPDFSVSKERINQISKEIEQSKALVLEYYRDSKIGRITPEMYDQLILDEQARQERLQKEQANFDEPDDTLVVNSEYLLSLLKRLPELYERSNDEEKLEWHKIIFSNATIKQNRLLWELTKPFDAVYSCNKTQVWLPRLGSNQRHPR